jgi:hypothetical protein
LHSNAHHLFFVTHPALHKQALATAILTFRDPSLVFAAMDHCLRLPEIVSVICDDLDSASAFSMALTAQRFVEPALDVRWRNVTSLAQIIFCLPGDLWKVEERPRPGDPEPGMATKIVVSRTE